MLQIVWRNPDGAPRAARVALSRFGYMWTAYFRVGAFTSRAVYEMVCGGLYDSWRPKRRRAS